MSTPGISPSARIAILLRRRIGSLREDRQFDKIVRQKHAHIFAFSMIGLLTMAATQIFVWSAATRTFYGPATLAYPSATRSNVSLPIEVEIRDTYYDFDDSTTLSPGFDTKVQYATRVNVLYLSQAVISWSTIVVGALITQKYRLLLMAKRAEWTGTSLIEAEAFRGDNVMNTQDRSHFLASYSFWRSTMKWWFLVECLLQLPHPVLWMNSAYAPTFAGTKNIIFKFLQCYMFLRVLFIPDLIHLFSDAYIKRFEIVNRSRELLAVGYKFRWKLTLKIFFFENTVSTLVGVMILSVLMFGFAQWTVSRVEMQVVALSVVPEGGAVRTLIARLSDPRFGDLFNSIWFSYVAYATIGFGDYAPTVFLGRLVSAGTTLIGSMVFVLFAGVVVNRVSLTKEQRYSVEYLSTRTGDEVYRDAAVRLLQDFILFANAKLKEEKAAGGEIEDDRVKKRVVGHKGNRLYRSIRRFRAARQQLESAFMQPEDIVVNEKLAAIDLISAALRIDVEQYAKDVGKFEENIQVRLRQISDRVNRYVSRGNVAV